MSTATRLPAMPLRRYVARYGGYHFDGAPPSSHAGLPSRHLDLILSLGDPIEVVGAHASSSSSFQAFVSGLHDRPAQVFGPASPHGLHLLLTPLGARTLLGAPAGALAGQVVDLAALFGPFATELLARLHAALGWPAKFCVLDDMLLRIIRRPDQGHRPELEWAWTQLVRSHGLISVEGMARETGWSRRHLTGSFVSEFGLSPKVFARIIRFERACWLLKCGQDLAGVAAECGYYDQSHLTKEWTALTGQSPGRWAERELPFLQDYELSGGETVGLSRLN